MPLISFEDVHLNRQGREILKGINLDLGPGENWAILGPNGSGKSSLLSLLMAYQVATSGKLVVFGKTFGLDPWPPVKDRIGLVSSSLDTFREVLNPMTVKDLVISGIHKTLGLFKTPSTEDLKICDQLLDRYGLRSLERQSYQSLSSGEQKKLMIVRSLASKPDLLVLDEAVANLDIYQRRKLLNFLDDLACPLIYTCHHVEDLPKKIDHLALIKEGRIFKAGPIDEIMTDDNLSQAFSIQVRVEKTNLGYRLLEVTTS